MIDQEQREMRDDLLQVMKKNAPAVRDVILQVLEENSGGAKETRLFVEVGQAFQAYSLGIDLDDFENALTDLIQEGTIEILTYAWRMSDDLERVKRFIYTPSH